MIPNLRNIKPSLSAPIVTKRWRDMSPKDRAFFNMIHLLESGHVRLFTLLLTNDIKRKIDKSGQHPAEYISRRFQLYFKNENYMFTLSLIHI